MNKDLKGVPDRITVVESVYHQTVGKDPHRIESRFSRKLESHNQPYERYLSVGEEWQPLDCGWLKEVGMLVIQNEEGKFTQVQPTEEERKEASKKILELAYFSAVHESPIHPIVHGCWVILPGESIRACPSHVRSLYIRCQDGIAEYTLNLLPR